MSMMMRRPAFVRLFGVLLLVTVCLTATGCGDAPDPRSEVRVDTLAGGAVHVTNPRAGLWEAAGAEGWHLEEEVRIGALEGGGPDVFGQIRGIAVDSRGRVHVLDAQANEVRVFASDGSHVRTLGGTGSGPGELNRPFGLGVDGSDRVWAADQMNNRYTVWDAEGRLVASKTRPFASWPFIWTATFEGERLIESVLVGWETGERGTGLVRVDLEDARADTFPIPPSPLESEVYSLETEDGMMMMGTVVPFSPGQTMALTGANRYWIGTSDRYRLHLARFEGDTLRVVERAYEPVPVTRAERDAVLGTDFFEEFRERGGDADPARVPGVKPAFEWMVEDDRGHLWVKLPNPEGEDGTRLDVFDPEGFYLGRVRTPLAIEGWPRPVIRDGVVWAHVQDDLDVSYVVGLRVEEG